MKLRHLFAIAINLTIMLMGTSQKAQADSYPYVHNIYAKGEYVFLNGYAYLRVVDGKISRLHNNEVDVRIIDRSVERVYTWSPESDLWCYKGSRWGWAYNSSENPTPPDGNLMRYDWYFIWSMEKTCVS